jgi:tRNA threonylcarbamoyladenosine biosynthesis protein TsaB
VTPTDGPLLAFDTSGPHLAAALVRDDAPWLTRTVPMEKGQAEALMPFLEALLAEGGLTWANLGALAVGVGPGNFTGVRIAVSAARGLALGLGVPVFGVSSFQMLRDPAAPDMAEWISLPAPRDQAHVQPFADGQPVGAPRLIDPESPPDDLPRPTRIRGHRAEVIAAALTLRSVPVHVDPAELSDLPRRLAQVAAGLRAGGLPPAPPAPLYVRPPDAAPPSEAPPVLIE